MSPDVNLKPIALRASASLIALTATFAPVNAAEWDLGVGGYFEAQLGYASYNSPTAGDFDGVDAVASSEFYFRPSITLDNGIKLTTRIDFEGHVGESGAGGEFDEFSFAVRGSFGEIIVGKTDTPGNDMHSGAPMGYGPVVNFTGTSSNALGSFIPFMNVHGNRMVGDDFHRGTLGSTFASNSGPETHGRIKYISPTIAGFQLGASFGNESPNGAPDRDNFQDVALRYAGEFGAIRVAATGSYGVADNSRDPNARPEVWGAGINIGYGGLTVGGSFAESNNSSNEITDGSAMEVGASFMTGPWSFGLNYMCGKNVDDEHAGFGPRERFEAITFTTNYYLTGHPQRPVTPPKPGAGYDSTYGLAQGVSVVLTGFASYASFKEEVGDGGFGTPGDDVDGFVIGTGIKVSF